MYNPQWENCVICGYFHEKHKCNPKVLAAIDAQMKRDDIPERPRSFNERLSYGFMWMEGPSGENYEM